MATTAKQLIEWFRERPIWIQDAVRRLYSSGTLSPVDDAELLKLCKTTAIAPALSEQMLNFKVTANKVILKTLSEPKGIDQLNPKKVLQFDERLTIIYGNNGCGKSGYVRILKSICGARSARELAGNVFDPDDVAQSCKFAFALNGVDGAEIQWCPTDGAHAELRCMEVYDTEGGALYTTAENEVLFEPPLLSMIQQIIHAAGRIQTLLEKEIRALPSKQPEMPAVHAGSQSAILYPNINAETKDSTIESECAWSEQDTEKLTELNRRLAEANPADEAKKLRKLKKSIEDSVVLFKGWRTALDDKHAEALETSRALAASTRKTASEDAQRVFAEAPLPGVGEESWKRLWEHARAYSTEVAYKEAVFPKVDDGAKCVLCQQYLSDEAKHRLSGFEGYVNGQLEKDAGLANAALQGLLDALPGLDTVPAFTTRLDSIQITNEDTRAALMKFHEALQSRVKSIVDAKALQPLPSETEIDALTLVADGLEEKAKKLDEDAKAEGKDALRTEAKDLAGRKWLSEQKSAVTSERNRLVEVKKLEAVKKSLNTKALSDKKAGLTTELITDAFVTRFQAELVTLGAPKLKVAIKKTGTTKGQVLHQVQLTSARAEARTADVLSEGEQRVVSLAAFLADSEGGDATAPFIFDDPISSLDQDYEEATVRRLVALAKKRQVIVFTHRISLLTFLKDVADSEGIKPHVVGLQKEPWGTGEPASPPLFAMKPKEVINLLLNDRVTRARKVLADDGTDAYNIQAKAICSEVRIAIEGLVESILLNGIVQRFRRSVMTMGKLDKLSQIKPADCRLLDDMMTEYSKYEHSQSDETPLVLPDPDKLTADLKKLKDWVEEFAKRS